MRKLLIATLVGGLFFATIGTGVASAFPAAPRANTKMTAAQPSAVQFNPVKLVQRVLNELSNTNCINIDFDQRWTCLGSATPPVTGPCTVIVGVPGVITFYNCGPSNPNPPGATCINIDRDNHITCFFGATPDPSNGTCTPVLGVPQLIELYKCSSSGLPQRVGRVIRRILP